ncbi:MAG: hypothetical protein HQL39_11770, partial [Alphaproteobacteria bacterium]|nr:hypothetical protein [Alphaproteobacteria bacterium]
PDSLAEAWALEEQLSEVANDAPASPPPGPTFADLHAAGRIGTRLANVMRHARFERPRDVVERLGRDDVRDLPLMGAKSFAELEALLAGFGLHLDRERRRTPRKAA